MLRFSTIQVVFALLLALSATSLRGDFDEQLGERLQGALDQTRQRLNDRGVGVAVHIPGLGVWTGASGLSHGSTPMEPDRRFFIGSITKTLTATVIMQLVEDSRLTLNSTIGEILPELDNPNIDKTITVEQLLSHRSGIFNYTNASGSYQTVFSDLDRNWTKTDLITTFVNRPAFLPGTSYQYSNTNYIVLGLMIERLIGSNVSSIFDQRFFQPLGFENSRLPLIDDFDRSLFAHGFASISNVVPGRDLLNLSSLTSFITFFNTAGGVYMNPEELALWLHGFFTKAFVSNIEEMRRLRSSGYGLGLMRLEIDGTELWGHGGLVFYHQGWALHWLETGISIVVFNNDAADNSTDYLGPLLSVLKEEKLPQFLRFAPILDQSFGDAPIPLSFHAPTESMPVEYELLSGSAKIKNGAIRPMAPGRIVIRARQAGNAHYNATESVVAFDLFDTTAQGFTTSRFPNLYIEGNRLRLALPASISNTGTTVEVSSDLQTWQVLSSAEAYHIENLVSIYSTTIAKADLGCYFRITRSVE